MASVDSFADEFARLAISSGLAQGTKAYKNQRRTFIASSAAEGFAEHFGRNEADLKAWQDLCRTVGIPEEDIPQSIKGGKKVSVVLAGVKSPLRFGQSSWVDFGVVDFEGEVRQYHRPC